MSNPNPPATRPCPSIPDSSSSRDGCAHTPRWFVWLGVFALTGYLLFLGGKTTVAAGGSDSSGYLNSARLLAQGILKDSLRLPPEFGQPPQADLRYFTPLGYLPPSEGTPIAPAYPTGLPLHFVAAASVLGWHAGPFLIELLAAAGALWLCYLTARELGINHWLAAAGAAVLAVFPVFLFTSIQTLSDTLATTWTLAAFYCGLRARTRKNWAAACGLAFSIAVLVRPTNVLFTPALLVLLGLDFGQLVRFGLSGVPAAAWFLLYNRHQYGSPLETGYPGFTTAFSTIYGIPTLKHFGKWLALFLPAVLLVLPFAAAADRFARGRALLALALAFLAVTVFYLFYDVSHDVWWCLRFILPATPPLILAGLLGVETLARGPGSRWPRAFRPAAALVLAVWALANSFYWTPKLHVLLVQGYEQTYADAGNAARERLPQNALVACNNFSGAMFYYTPFSVVRADVIEAPEFRHYASLAQKAGRPVCAVLFDFEEEEAFARCPGQWKRLSTLANVGYWQLQ